MKRIYLDHAASTPLHPQAAQAMGDWLRQKSGNPSSLHADGRAAKERIDEAREVLASAARCLFGEFLFTSSGTESTNFAIIGGALSQPPSRRRVILGAADHHASLHCQSLLAKLGFTVDSAPVDNRSQLDPDALANLMGDDVAIVSILQANNELGVFSDVSQAVETARRFGVLTHVDAVQAFPAFLVDADLISVSAHKLNGPQGVGGLIVKSGVKLHPLIAGGGQEREARAGTENVAGIIGFAEAVKWRKEQPDLLARRRTARDAFVEALNASGTDPAWTALRGGLPTEGEPGSVLGGHAHLRFPGISAESMLIRLDLMGVSASSGAACSSGSLEPSHVLLACGFSPAEAQEGLRFTFGWETTPSEATHAAELVADAVRHLRA